MRFHKYHGAGNDFILFDNRKSGVSFSREDIRLLCHRHLGLGADGLMLLNPGVDGYDFSMEYYNSDGSGGMMCGNGGRCLVAFACDLGIDSYRFIAADGLHEAVVVEDNGHQKTVKLGMIDVEGMEKLTDTDYFLNTGTRHVVRFVNDMAKLVIDDAAVALRHDIRFAPEGTNVNLAFWDGDTLHVRTFEKGVEAETMACGTGVVASALAAKRHFGLSAESVRVKTPGGDFEVHFFPTGTGFKNITLTGPTSFVGYIDTPLLSAR